MKKILLLVIVLLLHTNCTAQNVYPLNTSVLDLPQGAYLKDLNDELDSYVGKWKAQINETTVILNINKQYKTLNKIDNKTFYRDQIIITYTILSNNGNVLENVLDPNSEYVIKGYKIQKETLRVMCIYYGKQCSLGNGFVYLKKQGNNQLLWSYYPQAIHVTSQNEKECKGEIYLPEGENIVFTRQ
ncbi:hypothetical protein D1Z98_00610 [Riemerella anatipestifer]|uniref:DUF6705 family protein n=1 Tax=Riemerella anatipestifer TaxID=34085 RepID=UPI000D6874F7|nr:DUF6705 family protein [Riemerella anatipestifer]MRM93529.1 hypothetical protein [Riemerella anatipestifer]